MATAKTTVKKASVKKVPTKKPVVKKATKKSPQLLALSEGRSAPAFQLLTDENKKCALKDFKGHWVVLYFYPKDMTSGCTQESCDFRDSYKKILGLGALILGVSKDSVQSHQKFKAKYDFPFPLLSDESTEVCQKYGVWKEKSLYGRKYMGIERMTFVINPQGKIAKIYSKVKVQGHVDEVMAFLAQQK